MCISWTNAHDSAIDLELVSLQQVLTPRTGTVTGRGGTCNPGYNDSWTIHEACI